MKLPGVSGVYDYAGPSRNLRCRSRPCCLPPMQKRQRPDCIFSKLNTQPACTPVYASPCTSRYPTQNSGPSGSLLLSRRTLPFPASCRFIPAHCIGDLAETENSSCLTGDERVFNDLGDLSCCFLEIQQDASHRTVLLAFRASRRADSKYQIRGAQRDYGSAFTYLLTTVTTDLSRPGHAGAPS